MGSVGRGNARIGEDIWATKIICTWTWFIEFMESQISCTPMNQSLMASCDYLTKSAPGLTQIMVFKFNNDWLNPKTSSKSEEGSMYDISKSSCYLGKVVLWIATNQFKLKDCHEILMGCLWSYFKHFGEATYFLRHIHFPYTSLKCFTKVSRKQSYFQKCLKGNQLRTTMHTLQLPSNVWRLISHYID